MKSFMASIALTALVSACTAPETQPTAPSAPQEASLAATRQFATVPPLSLTPTAVSVCIAPSVVGVMEDDAISALREAGLRPILEQTFSDSPKGVVLEQSPAAGVRLEPCDGDLLIRISLGMPAPTATLEPTELPPPTPESTASPSPTIAPMPTVEQVTSIPTVTPMPPITPTVSQPIVKLEFRGCKSVFDRKAGELTQADIRVSNIGVVPIDGVWVVLSASDEGGDHANKRVFIDQLAAGDAVDVLLTVDTTIRRKTSLTATASSRTGAFVYTQAKRGGC